MPLSLPYDVYKTAFSYQAAYLKHAPASVLARMKALSIWAHQDISKIEKVDPIKPSQGKYVNRIEAENAVPIFKGLIVPGLARSSLLLAELWDEIYALSGRPPIRQYRVFHEPLEPRYIPPADYILQSSR